MNDKQKFFDETMKILNDYNDKEKLNNEKYILEIANKKIKYVLEMSNKIETLVRDCIEHINKIKENALLIISNNAHYNSHEIKLQYYRKNILEIEEKEIVDLLRKYEKGEELLFYKIIESVKDQVKYVLNRFFGDCIDLI